jgi:hypothetical protein
MAIETQDHRRTLEGTEHESQTAVRKQMSRCLVSAARAIDVDDCICTKDAQGRNIARRDIHSTDCRSRSIEEDVLTLNELAMSLFDALKLLPHRPEFLDKTTSILPPRLLVQFVQ